MSTISSIDLKLIDDLVDFMRGPGYVLDFSDRSFAAFFATEFDININDPAYAKHGGSKGKRLRYFLQTADDQTAAQVLQALWEYSRRIACQRSSERPGCASQSAVPVFANTAHGRGEFLIPLHLLAPADGSAPRPKDHGAAA